MLDIDLFKNINDALGHATGDEALKAIAGVLAKGAEQHCFAARLGGDEFGIIAYGDRDQKNGADLMAWVKKGVDDLRTTNREIPVISITGGSAYFPGDASNRPDLLAAADLAQREAKDRRSAAAISITAQALTDTFRRETRIAQGINRAIAARALSLFFQPRINLINGRVEGAEALSRFPGKVFAGTLEETMVAKARCRLSTTMATPKSSSALASRST